MFFKVNQVCLNITSDVQHLSSDNDNYFADVDVDDNCLSYLQWRRQGGLGGTCPRVPPK